jgi:dephospho-CoA kinase
MKIAVTGGLGSGKSTVSKILASYLQCELLDTDQLCRQQLQPGHEGLARLKECFGNRFLCSDGTLDRQKLRIVTFENLKVKSQLEDILHPIVREIVAARFREKELRGEYLVVEVPLLYEVQWQNDFDECVVVYAPESIVYERVALRSGLRFFEIRSILDVQMPIEEKRKYTRFIIDNSGTFVSTMLQTANLSKRVSV